MACKGKSKQFILCSICTTTLSIRKNEKNPSGKKHAKDSHRHSLLMHQEWLYSLQLQFWDNCYTFSTMGNVQKEHQENRQRGMRPALSISAGQGRRPGSHGNGLPTSRQHRLRTRRPRADRSPNTPPVRLEPPHTSSLPTASFLALQTHRFNAPSTGNPEAPGSTANKGTGNIIIFPRKEWL